MVYIMKIVTELRRKLGASVQVGSVETQDIDQAMLWTPEITQGKAHTLYLAQYPQEIPEEFLQPVLVVGAPEDASPGRHLHVTSPEDLARIFNGVQEILYQQLSVNLKKEELFQVLQTGAGIKALTAVAYSYLENPINVCDTSFSILHRLPDEGTDDVLEAGGRLLIKSDSIASMRTEKLVDKLFHARLPFFSDRVDYQYRWLYCNIRINEVVVGYICIPGKNRPFTEEDVEFVAVFASMLSVEMQKSEFFIQRTGLRYEYFLSDLLGGRFDDEQAVHKRLTHLGRSLDRNLWVLAFFYEKGQSAHLTSGYFAKQMGAILPQGMALLYDNTPVVLLSQKIEAPFHPHQEKLLEDFLQFNRMSCGVSYRFTGILEAPGFYRQALACGVLGEFADGRICRYGDIMVEHLLGTVKQSLPLLSLVHPQIRTLVEYDQAHNTEFGNTLRHYLREGRNATQTAAALSIHKSTLSYRIRKIGEIAGLTLEDTEAHFLFALSFRILDLL